jgi:hypothetical protein
MGGGGGGGGSCVQCPVLSEDEPKTGANSAWAHSVVKTH